MKGISNRMIFAKATLRDSYAIAIELKNNGVIVDYTITADDITGFITLIAELAKSYSPWIVHYECSVYMHECRDLRSLLYMDNIKLRGYKSEGTYTNRVVSQIDWIKDNVSIVEDLSDFIDDTASFNMADMDKDNIGLDVLSDATKYLRRYCFK